MFLNWAVKNTFAGFYNLHITWIDYKFINYRNWLTFKFVCDALFSNLQGILQIETRLVIKQWNMSGLEGVKKFFFTSFPIGFFLQGIWITRE